MGRSGTAPRVELVGWERGKVIQTFDVEYIDGVHYIELFNLNVAIL